MLAQLFLFTVAYCADVLGIRTYTLTLLFYAFSGSWLMVAVRLALAAASVQGARMAWAAWKQHREAQLQEARRRRNIEQQAQARAKMQERQEAEAWAAQQEQAQAAQQAQERARKAKEAAKAAREQSQQQERQHANERAQLAYEGVLSRIREQKQGRQGEAPAPVEANSKAEAEGVEDDEQGKPQALPPEAVHADKPAGDDADRSSKWQERARAAIQRRLDQLDESSAEAKAKLQKHMERKAQEQQLQQQQQERRQEQLRMQAWQQHQQQQQQDGGVQAHMQQSGSQSSGLDWTDPSLAAERALREQQDAEFSHSLAADQQRAEQRVQEHTAKEREQQRWHEYRALQQRLRESLPPEPDPTEQQGSTEGAGVQERRGQQQQQQHGELQASEAGVHGGEEGKQQQQQQPSIVKVRVRLPDGSQRTRRWLCSASGSQVRDWVQSLSELEAEPGTWQLVQGYPRTVVNQDSVLSSIASGSDSVVLLVERL